MGYVSEETASNILLWKYKYFDEFFMIAKTCVLRDKVY